MFDIERWQEIFEAISKNKLRTFLTGISVGSGIFILIILLGVGEGMQKGIKKQFEKDATSRIRIWTGRTSVAAKGLNRGRNIGLTLKDYKYAEDTYSENIEYKSAFLRIPNQTTTYKNEIGSYTLGGVMPDMFFLENASLIAGRFISERDMKASAKVVVIGVRVAKDLFKNYKKSIGKRILINTIAYTVIGVYTDPGGDREEDNIYAPHTTVLKITQNGTKAGQLNFVLNPAKDFNAAIEKYKNFIESYKKYLYKEKQIDATDKRAVRSYSSLESAEKFFKISTMMNLFFWGIGVLTLIAGIVGVSNIMLIIVKERTKEIGIRKALGAQPISIVAMILHEAIFITFISGFIGLFLALILLEFVGPEIESDFIVNPHVDFSIAVTTVLLLVFSGAFAGFIPARHASRIKPIIALRDE